MECEDQLKCIDKKCTDPTEQTSTNESAEQENDPSKQTSTQVPEEQPAQHSAQIKKMSTTSTKQQNNNLQNLKQIKKKMIIR